MSAFLTPLLLFLGGLGYIAIDTIRLMVIQRGHRRLAAGLGVVEVVVFLVAVSKVLSGPLDWLNVMAYALGFGAGTFVGGYLEGRMALGYVAARVITTRDASALLEALAKEGFGITNVAAQGQFGKRRILFSIMRRRHLGRFMQLVHQFHPQAFISYEDVHAIGQAMNSFMGDTPAVPPTPPPAGGAQPGA